MVFGFGKKNQQEEELSEDQELIDQLDDLQKSTEEIEAEKEAKRIAREERKFRKEIEAKKKKRERLVAPFILIATIVVSLVLWIVSGK